MKIKLIQITLIISIIGILLLLTLVNFLPPKQLSIIDINNKLISKQVIISGQITSTKIFEQSNFQLINLKDKTGSITITLNSIANFSTDKNITVIGRVTEYNNTLQIQADKIINTITP